VAQAPKVQQFEPTGFQDPQAAADLVTNTSKMFFGEKIFCHARSKVSILQLEFQSQQKWWLEKLIC
jgi:hypothetical protein